LAVKDARRQAENHGVHLRIVPEPTTEPTTATFSPDHRSPRWLGLLGGVLGLLTAAQVFVVVDSLRTLLI
jgi:hypothetical protein